MPIASEQKPRLRRTIVMGFMGFLSAMALTLVGPALTASAEPPTQIGENATEGDEKWQPAMDYDTDSCYSTPAIAADGALAEGLEPDGGITENCRDAGDLGNTNTYVRTVCDGTLCGHVYAYYFEKDQATEVAGPADSGHKHDLEHVIVWVKDDVATHVSVSAHGKYEDTRPANEVRWEGTHPKVVYHKEGGSTHAMRFANEEDDAVENDSGAWHFPFLLSWWNMEPVVRDGLQGSDFGSASIDLKNDRIEEILGQDAAGEGFEFSP